MKILKLRSPFGKKPETEVKSSILPNGFTIETIKRDKKILPQAFIQLNVSVGWLHESLKERGHAHAAEHYLHQKNEERAAAMDEMRGECGAMTYNANTEYTYQCSQTNPENINRTLEIIAQSLKKTMDDPKQFQRNEINAIQEERVAAEGNWDVYVNNMARGIAYPNSRAGFSSFGLKSDIEKTTIADAQAFVAKHYDPSRMKLTVIADIDDHDATHAAIKEKFADISHREGKATDELPQARYVGGYKVEDTPSNSMSGIKFRMAFPIGGANVEKSEKYKTMLLAEILGGQNNSLIYGPLRNQGIYEMGASANVEANTGELMIHVNSYESAKIPEAVKTITTTIKDFNKSVTAERFSQAQNKLIGREERSMNYVNAIQQARQAPNPFEQNVSDVIGNISLEEFRNHARSVFSQPPVVAACGDKATTLIPKYSAITESLGYQRNVGEDGLVLPKSRSTTPNIGGSQRNAHLQINR